MPALPDIPSLVGFDLRPPILGSRFRHLVDFAVVSMPKATMDEDRDTMTRQYEIGCAGQTLPVEAESVSESMQQRPHGQFGLCVPRSDLRHQEGTGFCRELVGHIRRISADEIAKDQIFLIVKL